MRELIIARAISKLEKRLKRHGLTFECHSDFSNFVGTANLVRNNALSNEFDGDAFDMHAETGFWSCARSKQRPVSIQATRIERLGRRSLFEHLQSQQPRVYKHKSEFQSCCPFFKNMSGQIAYSGEFEMSDNWRGEDIAGILVILNFFIALLRWPDMAWIWGLMNEKLVKRGTPQRMGFSTVLPNGVTWKNTPPGIENSDWLVASSGEDLEHWATIIAERGVSPLLLQRKA